MKKRSIQVMLILFFMTAVALLLLNGNLSVSANAATNYEMESNDTPDKANVISLNTKVSGSLYQKSDVDWYKFTITKAGYVQVVFDHSTLSSSNAYWQIGIYDAAGKNSATGASSLYKVNGDESRTLTSAYGLVPGTYTLKISPYNYSANSYSFSVDFEANDKWERELNNNKGTANPIEINTFYQGSIAADGDYDWYQFELEKQTDLNFVFSRENKNSSYEYWDVYIYNKSDTKVFSASESGDAEKTTSDSFKLSAGVYYLRISDHNPGVWSTGTDDVYGFVVMEKHEHCGTWHDVGAVTCTSPRTQERICEICGLVERQTLDPVGHLWNSGRDLEPATLLQVGEVEYKCIRCGEKEIVEDKSVLWLWWPITVGAVMLIFGIACYAHLQRHS